MSSLRIGLTVIRFPFNIWKPSSNAIL